MTKMKMKYVLLLLGAGALAGCAEEDAGRGTLALEVWGEEFIEQGIPEDVFSDGWSVTFDRFLVAIDGVAVGCGNRAPDLEDVVQRVFDLTRSGPYPFLTREVPAGRYDNTTYSLRPAVSAATAGNAAVGDVELMKREGYSVYAEGSARRDAVVKTFAWGFETSTVYLECESEADLENGSAATVQLTIHADHLFYDDLFSEEPAVTFDVLAQADADDDGEVTAAELAAFDLTALPNYGTGSTDVDNLWDFISHLTGTLGHIDGEGHCHAEAM